MQRKNLKELIVWQKAVSLAELVHTATLGFPRHETFGLAQQLRRASVSIPSNIAEGAARGSTRDYLRFMHIARGSHSELETQLQLAHRFGYVTRLEPLERQLDEVGRLINAVIAGLRRRIASNSQQRV